MYIWLETSGAMWSTLSRGVSSMPPPTPVQNNLHVWLNFECSHFSWRNQWHRHGGKLAEKRWLWIVNSLHDHLSQLSCRQVSCKNMAWNCMVYEEKTTATVRIRTSLSKLLIFMHCNQQDPSNKEELHVNSIHTIMQPVRVIPKEPPLHTHSWVGNMNTCNHDVSP